ncbi:MAG: hypothetical protein KKB37_03095 [Alphaproteobacteria bacterium]|nr:hypothetical protein [Alphaproteobacteria bacterium]
MMTLAHTISSAIAAHLRGWLALVAGFAVLYYLALLAAMIYRFGNWPNYITPYNWIANVQEIIRATPSVQDMLPIIRDEWLLEVGYMNMDYGNGISEWSLNLIPSKMAVILLLGMLIATVWALALEQRTSCERPKMSSCIAASGAGATLVGLTGATMSWVVCCATPSWIVGLAMLGLGVSTANWLEPAGTWIGALGFIVMATTIIAQARGLRAIKKPAPTPSDRHAVNVLAAMEVGQQ